MLGKRFLSVLLVFCLILSLGFAQSMSSIAASDNEASSVRIISPANGASFITTHSA
jgi:hypothetical protein